MFRSYDRFRDPSSIRQAPVTPGPANHVSLYDLSRATLSRPGYFSSVKIQQSLFIDAQRSCHNPSAQAIREMDSRQDEADDHTIDCMVSIGCGHPSPVKPGEPPDYSKRPLIQRLEHEKTAAWDGELTHSVTSGSMRSWKKAYFRLDHSSDEWEAPVEALREGGETLMRNKRLEEEVLKELNGEEMREVLSKCAKCLVARKRNKL